MLYSFKWRCLVKRRYPTTDTDGMLVTMFSHLHRSDFAASNNADASKNDVT